MGTEAPQWEQVACDESASGTVLPQPPQVSGVNLNWSFATGLALGFHKLSNELANGPTLGFSKAVKLDSM